MLTQMLIRAAQTTPEKTAIVQGNQRISYQQLDEQASSVAGNLRRLGIKSSDCVGVVLANCPEFIISLFACARLGAVMLPLNPQYTQDELQRFLVDGQVKILIADELRFTLCQQIIVENGLSFPLVVLGKSQEQITNQEQTIDFKALLVNAVGNSPGTAEVLTGPALYLYTSGSTSAYKRLCCTQENLYYEAHNFVETLGLTADDAILCTVPLYHSYGFGNGLLDAVYAGSTLVLLEPVQENGRVIDTPFVSRTQRVLELIKEESIRFFPGVPYQFNALAELSPEVPADLSGLKWCISSGDILPKHTYERFLQRYGIAIRSLYGSTEAGSICINTDSTEAMEFGSLGLPLLNVQIEIRDEFGKELPVDSEGAIWVKSPVIPPNGYDNRPELTAEVFHHGFYETGDVGMKDRRGHLIITGRKQSFVDVGGYKVDIGEVEEVLESHPAIREAAVLGVDSEHAGQLIKAVIVSQEACEAEEILAYCRNHLAAYKLPRLIEFRDDLPRTALGKVIKKELQNPLASADVATLSILLQSLPQASREKQIEFIALQLQQQVAATLQVSLDDISLTASFQSLGFDSIRAAELQSRLIQLTGFPLAITLLWNHPCIAELAEVLADKLQIEPDTVVPVQELPTKIASSVDGLQALWQDIVALAEADVDSYFASRMRPVANSKSELL